MTKVIYDLPAPDYHALPALSNTGLGYLALSPAHYQEWRQHPPEPTPEMRLGTATHLAVLEPERWDLEARIAPDVDRRTKAGREAWDAFQLEHAGKLVLSAQDADTVRRIAEAVRAHPVASELLAERRAEVTALWDDGPVPCKLRADWVSRHGIVADLKTTQCAAPGAFARTVAQRGYHRQAAWYLDGLERCGVRASHFLFIAAEKAPPWAVAVYALSADDVERGRTLYQRGLEVYRQCVVEDRWPAYPTLLTLTLPAWSRRDEHNGTDSIE